MAKNLISINQEPSDAQPMQDALLTFCRQKGGLLPTQFVPVAFRDEILNAVPFSLTHLIFSSSVAAASFLGLMASALHVLPDSLDESLQTLFGIVFGAACMHSALLLFRKRSTYGNAENELEVIGELDFKGARNARSILEFHDRLKRGI
ncbi:MAG: hypothetical protein AAGL10_09310 [Pseudomonadota bacterium]